MTIIIPKDSKWSMPLGQRYHEYFSGKFSSHEMFSDGSLHRNNCFVSSFDGFPRWARRKSFYNNKREKDKNHLYIMCHDSRTRDAKTGVVANDEVYDFGSSAKTYVVEGAESGDKKIKIFKYRPLAYDEFSMGKGIGPEEFKLKARPVPVFPETKLFNFLASGHTVFLNLEYDSPYTLQARETARKTAKPNVRLVDLQTGKWLTEINIKAGMSDPSYPVTRIMGGYVTQETIDPELNVLWLGYRNEYGSMVVFSLVIPAQFTDELKGGTYIKPTVYVLVHLYGALTSADRVDFNILIPELEKVLEKAIKAGSPEYYKKDEGPRVRRRIRSGEEQ
ncbi:MAG: hypothetical protein LBI68_02505 [Azoarcus sp.]|nr:hypothetical protein [Azoarcus sp.]